MKKTIIALCLAFVLIASVGFAVSGKNQNQIQNDEFTLPENAVEVSPGVFYLGEDKDVDGTPVKGYAIIHYEKGYESDFLESDTPATDYDTSTCYAFIWNDIRWNTVEGYVINPTNDFGISAGDMETIFENSISTWEEYSGDVIGEATLNTDTSNQRRPDGTNLVRFRNLQRGVIAMNIIWTDGINLMEWDQMYSNKFNWGDAEANSLLMDFQNIATHELGHAFGLADLYTTECNTQTMFGYSTEGDIEKRTLESGDITGIQTLYGTA